MSNSRTLRIDRVVVFVWSIGVIAHLVNEALRLFEIGSGLVAVGSSLVALTALYVGPALLALGGLLVFRRFRVGGHAT
jgi:hypothetical protein